MPVHSKNKGAAFERKVAGILKEMGITARRGQQFHGLEGKDVVSDINWHIECKAVESLNVCKAFKQAKRDADEGETPVVIHKKNLQPILITMELADFEKAAKEFFKAKNIGEIPW